MQRSSLYCVILLAATLSGFYGCKKVNGINNNTVIETPYALYYSDTAGTLFVTNDGLSHRVVFESDGAPCRAICVSGNNILFAKTNLYVSINNGVNFNHGFDSLQSVYHVAVNGVSFNLNQSMLVDCADWNKVYTVTNQPHNIAINQFDYLGVEYTNNHGIRGSYACEGTYDTNGNAGQMPVRMVSYTRLPNGILAGLAISHYINNSTGIVDTVTQRNFYKACGTDDCPWKETTGRGTFGASDTNGVPLPPTVTYPDTGFFTLGHYNGRLIAIDQTGKNGAFYSDDTGRIWKKYSGIPAKVPLLCIASPFEQVCLIGTYGAGLYILNTNTQSFQPNNNGLARDLIVRSIAFKQNYYKNGTKKRYVYLATNRGIFQSTDDGINWIMTIPGNYTAIY